MRVAICEDCPIQSKIILMLLDNYKAKRPALEIYPSCFQSGFELLESIKHGAYYDLFLLDILMPYLNGIELAKEIRKNNDDAVIVFLTQSYDYAYDAFKVSAVQYIVKPIKENILFPMLDKVIPFVQQKIERFFTLSTSDGDVKIPFSFIICIEFADRKLSVYLTNGTTLYTKCLRTSFSEVVTPLLKDSRFFRVHQSFVVNIVQVIELMNDSFVMSNNISVPIPRNKYPEAKKWYFDLHLLR